MIEYRFTVNSLKDFVDEIFGRKVAIETKHCIPAPIGCGGLAEEFRNEISEREYKISGLCQECQDKVFGED